MFVWRHYNYLDMKTIEVYSSAAAGDLSVWTCLILIGSGLFGSEFPHRRMFSLRDAHISVAEPISISQSKLQKTHPPREKTQSLWCVCVCVCVCVVSGGVKCIVGRGRKWAWLQREYLSGSALQSQLFVSLISLMFKPAVYSHMLRSVSPPSYLLLFRPGNILTLLKYANTDECTCTLDAQFHLYSSNALVIDYSIDDADWFLDRVQSYWVNTWVNQSERFERWDLIRVTITDPRVVLNLYDFVSWNAKRESFFTMFLYNEDVFQLL